MGSLKTGQVAEAANVGVETIRFYERQKLIAEPPRSPSGYRAYPEDVIDRIRFIRQAKDLGFTLNEIRELLSLRVRSTDRCEAVKRRSEAKLIDIETKIRSLQRIRRTLRKLVNDCDERAPTSDCPILGAIEKGARGQRKSGAERRG
jgi:MerR family mercuric resistance operon transcriptional regulator